MKTILFDKIDSKSLETETVHDNDEEAITK